MLQNQTIKDIKFGHNEAKRDHGLIKYFFDDGTIKSILEGEKFFVFGRKGSGKSAICRYLDELATGEYNLFSKVLSFKDFGMEKLYKFSDRDFRSPTQYQTFWRYLLYIELAKMVLKDESVPKIQLILL
ncbi:hypothetical protein N752_29910 [Desulforamulus aquiferis]|nr:hypothetical protein N752_29910 [Desulforamulus aquiferis]